MGATLSQHDVEQMNRELDVRGFLPKAAMAKRRSIPAADHLALAESEICRGMVWRIGIKDGVAIFCDCWGWLQTCRDADTTCQHMRDYNAAPERAEQATEEIMAKRGYRNLSEESKAMIEKNRRKSHSGAPTSEETKAAERLIAEVPDTGKGGADVCYRVRQDVNGVIWCECEGWLYSKSMPRTCRHLAILSDEGLIPVQFRELFVAEPSPIPEPVVVPAAEPEAPSTLPFVGATGDEVSDHQIAHKRTRNQGSVSQAFAALRKAGLCAVQNYGKDPDVVASELLAWAKDPARGKRSYRGVVFFTKGEAKKATSGQAFYLYVRPTIDDIPGEASVHARGALAVEVREILETSGVMVEAQGQVSLRVRG